MASKRSTTKRGNSLTAPPQAAPPSRQLSLAAKNAKALPATPPQEHINQWGYFAGSDPVSGWTVGAVADTLQNMRAGNFNQAGLLADDMAANPRIMNCLEERFNFATTAPLTVVPTARRGDGRRCADFVREVLPDILPVSVLRDLHRNYVMMGFSVAAIDWIEYKDGKDRVWLPRIKPWQTQLLYYQQFADADSVDLGAFIATTLNRGVVRVDPGESRWVLFQQSQIKPWLRGATNVLATSYLGDEYNFRDNMAFQDHFGRGIFKMHIPVSWKNEEIAYAAQTLRAGAGGGVFPLPTNAQGQKLGDLELVQADGGGYKTFGDTDIRVLDRINIALLGQTMTTRGSAGGFAQARVHSMGLWRKYEQDAAVFGDAVLTSSETVLDGGVRGVQRQWQPRDGVLRTQVMKWLAYWNFGSMDLAPYVYWNLTEPADIDEQRRSTGELMKTSAAALQALGQAIEKLDAAGVKYDVDYLVEQVGLKLRRDEEAK